MTKESVAAGPARSSALTVKAANRWIVSHTGEYTSNPPLLVIYGYILTDCLRLQACQSGDGGDVSVRCDFRRVERCPRERR